ncbi:MAG: EAL domain-containing protein [Gammaproteobacteria bacterium]
MTYNILHFEDDKVDAKRVAEFAKKARSSVEVTHVDNKEDFFKALESKNIDLIFSNYSFSKGSALEVLNFLKNREIYIPLVVVTKAIGDEKAIDIIKQGAEDYVLKDKLFRLPAVIDRLLEQLKHKDETNEMEVMQSELVASTHAGLLKMDVNGGCVYVNDRLCQIVGRNENELLGDAWLQCFHEEDRGFIISKWTKAVASQEVFETVARISKNDGDVAWVSCHVTPKMGKDRKLLGFIGTLIDITNIKKADKELEKYATSDPLTMLPNRHSFNKKIERTLQTAQHFNELFAIMFVDLDHFKKINDTFGHNVGDELLRQAAQRFRAAARDTDFIYRVGGDEFIILVDHMDDMVALEKVASRILNSFSKPFYIEGKECFTTVSIGVATYPYAGHARQDLVQHADQALYYAKEKGRNNYIIFSRDMHDAIEYSARLEASLRHAIQKDELSVVYQPVVNVVENKVVGFEVLARWKNKNLGAVSPEIFFSIADEIGLSCDISRWVIEKSFREYGVWKKNFPGFLNHDFMLAINLSMPQLCNQDLVEYLKNQCQRNEISPRNVSLELTESVMMKDPDKVKLVLHDLADLGFKVAVDDFGAGYSSLNYLSQLPLDILKIDKSFVRNMLTEKQDAMIVKAVLSLAKSLNISVIAEGVESEEFLIKLKDYGCEFVQGFYISRPLASEKVVGYLRNEVFEKAIF